MERIKTIADEIRQKYGEESAWFFWSKNKAGKEGLHKASYYIPIKWLPNSKRIMFVAPNPSTGKYTDKENKDKLRIFLDKLEEHHFAKRVDATIGDTHTYYEGCFVTDLVKIRLSKGEAKKHLQKFEESIWKDYLDREIRIVNPLLIAALGYEAYEVLRRLEALDRPVEQIHHYGVFRFRRQVQHYNFDKQLKRISLVHNFLANVSR